jgi:hypothetical protein
VRVYDTARDIEWFWDKSKFINRVYLIRERYERFAAGEADAVSWGDASDPFWDPNEPAQVPGLHDSDRISNILRLF